MVVSCVIGSLYFLFDFYQSFRWYLWNVFVSRRTKITSFFLYFQVYMPSNQNITYYLSNLPKFIAFSSLAAFFSLSFKMFDEFKINNQFYLLDSYKSNMSQWVIIGTSTWPSAERRGRYGHLIFNVEFKNTNLIDFKSTDHKFYICF